eukprot:gene9001-biopygen14951
MTVSVVGGSFYIRLTVFIQSLPSGPSPSNVFLVGNDVHNHRDFEITQERRKAANDVEQARTEVISSQTTLRTSHYIPIWWWCMFKKAGPS